MGHAQDGMTDRLQELIARIPSIIGPDIRVPISPFTAADLLASDEEFVKMHDESGGKLTDK